MSIEPLPILTWPDRRLYRQCSDVKVFDGVLKAFADQMVYTMKHANGIGLAAPQVNAPINMIVVDLPCVHVENIEDTLPPKETSQFETSVLINPRITNFDQKNSFQWEEGCLSVPGYFEYRSRPAIVTVEFQTTTGDQMSRTFDNLHAFIVQHEIDHLDGKVFVDNLSTLKKDRIKKRITKARKF